MPGGVEWEIELGIFPVVALTTWQGIQGIVGAVAGAAKRKQKASRIRSAGVTVSANQWGPG